MRIEGDHNIRALQHGGADWWEREPEPAGRFVRLRIVEQPPTHRSLNLPAPPPLRAAVSRSSVGLPEAYGFAQALSMQSIPVVH